MKFFKKLKKTNLVKVDLSNVIDVTPIFMPEKTVRVISEYQRRTNKGPRPELDRVGVIG